MNRRLAVLVAVSAAAASLFVASPFLGATASAHPSDCHAQQTCPSDDHSYVWYDGSGQGWDCALAGDPSSAGGGGATVITYDDQSYACYPTGSRERQPPRTATTAPAETTAPPAPPPARKPKPRTPRASTRPAGTPAAPGSTLPTLRPAPVRGAPSGVEPKLTRGGYVFPVYGPSSFTDTYGAPRATTAWHHGIDIFAPLGAPILAVADGTVFSVGWNDVGGNRLWLRDRYGNQFYYAHLSAFTPMAENGRHVRAGTVLGFNGNTGDAAGTPYHLHFEIHPVSRLHLGYDGSINPYGYLLAWKRVQDVRLSAADARFAAAAGWAGPIGARATAPRPGAVLLQLSDISTASGLERGSLERALAAPVAIHQEAWPLERERKSLVKKGGRRADARLNPQEVGGSPEAWMQDVLAFDSPLVWDLLAQCEAGGDWQANTGNGYFGGLQFLPSTWARHGGYAYADSAHEATREQQIAVAERVLASEGWHAWPACSSKLGLR